MKKKIKIAFSVLSAIVIVVAAILTSGFVITYAPEWLKVILAGGAWLWVIASLSVSIYRQCNK